MNSIILVGSPQAREEYINDYIKKSNISPFNVIRITEPLKVSHAREIKRIISTSPYKSQRLITLPEDITTDAQQALLKTVEELPDGNTLIFEASAKDALLATICSRCTFVILTHEKMQEQYEIEKSLANLLENTNLENSFSVMMLVDSLGVVSSENFKEIILAARNIMLKQAKSGKKGLYTTLKTLKRLNENYALSQSNNVNKRMALENALLNK